MKISKNSRRSGISSTSTNQGLEAHKSVSPMLICANVNRGEAKREMTENHQALHEPGNIQLQQFVLQPLRLQETDSLPGASINWR